MLQAFQKTIKEYVQLEGVGLHNGLKANLKLKPAELRIYTGLPFPKISKLL